MNLEESIPQGFAEVAFRDPERIAVLADDGSLSYGELHRVAAGIAAGISGTGGHVGVMLGHGVRTPAAILGVLLSGNAYVPLDPSYPADRLGYMASHSRIGQLLVEPATAGLAGELTGVPRLDVTTVPALEPRGVGPSTSDSVAYVLYTSGSTGRPKGVLQNHRNVRFQVRHHAASNGIGPEDRVSVLSSFSFDASVTDLFTALLTGATAVLVDIRTHGLGNLARRLAGDRVTIYHSTPTVYRFLLGALGLGERLPDMRVVLLGGEELTARDVRLHRRHFAEHCVLINGYGATEVSFACQHRITHADEVPEAVLPIGRPLPGAEILLLEPHGEIAVRCPHVAVGYWADDEATAAKFTEVDGVRCYRTGDLGRRLADGAIVFAGRRDRQVKIRGYRVELGEVEAALAEEPVAGQVAVAARAKADGTAEIVAYVVAAAGREVDPATLRALVAQRLPPFMVPAVIVPMDALPLTPTGKVDTRALPEPPARPAAGAAPRTELERVVAQAWCAVLDRPSVGITENFLDAGGHSLQLASVARRLEDSLGRPIPLHRMFEYPTVATLAAFLASDATGSTVSTVDGSLGRVADRMARRKARRGGS
jgi:amino acid adenylation domain-containing protein